MDVSYRFKRSRAAANIPTSTGAARAVGKVCDLNGKLDGIASGVKFRWFCS